MLGGDKEGSDWRRGVSEDGEGRRKKRMCEVEEEMIADRRGVGRSVWRWSAMTL